MIERPAVCHRPIEAAAGNEFRNDVALAFGGAADVVDGDNARMVEPGDILRLVQVRLGGGGGGNQMRMRNLDGHLALQIGIEGQIDQTKGAFAQFLDHRVTTDRGAGRRAGQLGGAGTTSERGLACVGAGPNEAVARS